MQAMKPTVELLEHRCAPAVIRVAGDYLEIHARRQGETVKVQRDAGKLIVTHSKGQVSTVALEGIIGIVYTCGGKGRDIFRNESGVTAIAENVGPRDKLFSCWVDEPDYLVYYDHRGQREQTPWWEDPCPPEDPTDPGDPMLGLETEPPTE